jgi:hypothetical protein
VCGPDALDLVDRLVDRSLLVADTSGRASRVRMLESLRAYGIDRLTERGELEDAVAAQVDWCIALVEEAGSHVGGADQLRWLARLDDEHDNLRGALAAVAVTDPPRALRLLASLLVAWWFRGRSQEARHWAQTALAASGGAPDLNYVRVLSMSGLLAGSGDWQGRERSVDEDLGRIEADQRRALELSRTLDDEPVRRWCQLLLAVTLLRRSAVGTGTERAEAVRLVQDALPMFERVGDHYRACSSYLVMAISALASGDRAGMADAIAHARGHAQRTGDRFNASRIEWLEAISADAAGDTWGAYRHAERALRLIDELGMSQAVTVYAEFLAQLAARLGEPELSGQWASLVVDRGGDWMNEDRAVIAFARNADGLDARRRGEPEQAMAAHLQALDWYRAAGADAGTAFTCSCIGFLHRAGGDAEASARWFGDALDAAVAGGQPAPLALALEGIAVGGADTDPAGAARLLGTAERLWADADRGGTATHRGEVDAAHAVLVAALGADAADAERARGRALSATTAVELARALASVLQP